MTKFAQQVSRAIRILRGIRDESARASHLVVKKGHFMNNEVKLISQAEKEKFSQSTFFERKIMSTKTAFKRVALVAAAALAIGGISAVSAQAATAAAGGTVTLSASAVTSAVNVPATTNATFGFTSATNTDSGTLTVALVTKPAASAVSSASVALAAVSISTGDTRSITGQVDTLTSAGYVAVTHTSASATDSLTFTPDAPGVYTFSATNNVTGATVSTWTVTANQLSFTLGDGAPVAPGTTGRGVAGPANTVTVKGFSVDGTAVRSLITVSGAGATILSGGTIGSGSTSTVIAGALPTTPVSIVILTPTVGTVVVSTFNESGIGTGIYGTTATNIVTITVGATAYNNTYASAVSTNYGANGAGPANATSDAAFSVTVDKSAAGVLATFAVTELDQNGNPLTGAGLVAISAYATIGTLTGTGGMGAFAPAPYVAGTPNASISGFTLASIGVAGKSTVTITVGGVAKAYTVTFSSTAIATLTATVNHTVAIATTATAAGAAFVAPTTPAISVTTVDAAGNVNTAAQTGSTVVVTSSVPATATVTVGTYDSTNKWLPINVTGLADGTTVITISDKATGLVMATGSVVVSSVVASSATLTLNAAAYAAGDKVTYTLAAKDAAGNGIADGKYVGMLTGALTANQSITSTLAGPDVTFVNGSATGSFFAPATDFVIAGTTSTAATLVTALQGVTLTTTLSTVSNAATDAANAAVDAANEATDAANAATDAANAAADSADAATQAAQDAGDKADAALAAVVALSQQVTSVLAKVAALSKLLVRIIKKTHA